MMLRGRDKGLIKSGSIDHEDNMDLLNLRPQPFEKKKKSPSLTALSLVNPKQGDLVELLNQEMQQGLNSQCFYLQISKLLKNIFVQPFSCFVTFRWLAVGKSHVL